VKTKWHQVACAMCPAQEPLQHVVCKIKSTVNTNNMVNENANTKQYMFRASLSRPGQIPRENLCPARLIHISRKEHGMAEERDGVHHRGGTLALILRIQDLAYKSMSSLACSARVEADHKFHIFNRILRCLSRESI